MFESKLNIWQMVAGAGPMVKFVLLALLFLSIFSWAIILYKMNLLRKIEKETRLLYALFLKNRDLESVFAASKNYQYTPLARLLDAASTEISSSGAKAHDIEGMERLKRILKKTADAERSELEKAIAFLATTGNTAPFIGLFGTVWGIMTTFSSIGVRGSASLAVVAPGIAEALIATAMGLIAAIPAVVGYNHILTRIDRVTKETDGFSTDLINIFEKKLFVKSAKIEE